MALWLKDDAHCESPRARVDCSSEVPFTRAATGLPRKVVQQRGTVRLDALAGADSQVEGHPARALSKPALAPHLHAAASAGAKEALAT